MIEMQMKALFFDSPRVLRAMDAATRREMSWVGAFIRQRARTSTRKRKGIFRPGGPPHSRAGHLRRLRGTGGPGGRARMREAWSATWSFRTITVVRVAICSITGSPGWILNKAASFAGALS